MTSSSQPNAAVTFPNGSEVDIQCAAMQQYGEAVPDVLRTPNTCKAASTRSTIAISTAALANQQQTFVQQPHQQFHGSQKMLASNHLLHLNAIGQNMNMQLGNTFPSLNSDDTAAATTTTGANAEETDDGTRNSCGYGKYGQ
ncbi:hypothetical protein V6N13_084196 [Hibiscus sabdariffa]